MRFKKLLSFLLICIFIFNVSAPAVFAQTQEFTITGVGASVEAGTELQVDIVLQNNPGFSALNLYYTYDEEYFTLKSVENKIDALTMTHDKTTVWDSADNITQDGVLATLTFSVAKETPPGEYKFDVNFISAANDDFKALEANTESFFAEVTPISPKSVSLNRSSLTLDVDEAAALTATVYPSDAADKTVSWKSSNTSVATVDSNGVVKGVRFGTAVITATTNTSGCTASCTVSVNCKHEYSVKTVAPTYLEQGYNKYTCDICGHSYCEDFVAALERTDLSEAEVTLEYTEAFYEGKVLEPKVYLSYNGESYDANKELEITYENNGTAGVATVVIKGINKFKGTVTREFTVSFEVIPEPIVNVVAVPDYGKIMLSWGKSSEVNTNSYNIYRRCEDEEEFALLTTVRGRDNTSFDDSTAIKGKTYFYYVTGVGLYGAESEPSENAFATALIDLAPPTLLLVSPAAKTVIFGNTTLSATAEDNVGATKVAYYYNTDNSENWTLIGEASNSKFSIVFNTSVLGKAQAVKVKAIAYDAEGNQSEPIITVYSLDNTGPDKVKNLQSAPLSSKITLSWDDVDASDAAYFILEAKENGEWKTVASNITTLGYTVAGLNPNTDYTYRVACVDIHQNKGEYSAEFTAKTLEDVSSPVIISQGPSSARFGKQVDYYATAADDCDIKAITIQVSSDLKGWENVSTKEFESRDDKASYNYSVSLEKYSEGSLYIRAVATDFSGNMSDVSESAPYSEYIVDKTAPAAPKNIYAEGKNGYINISWQMGAEADLDKYSVYRADSKIGDYTLIASGLTTLNFIDRSTEADKEYYYKLRVSDTAGNISEYSDAVKSVMNPDSEKPVITGVSTAFMQRVSRHSKTIRVSAADNNALSYLLVEYCTADDPVYKTLIKKENICSHYVDIDVDLPLDGLTEGGAIHIRVIAADMAGLSSGYTMAKYILDETAPNVGEFTASIEQGTVTLNWNDCGEEDLAGFKVYRSDSGENFVLLGSRAAGSGSYSFTDVITAEESKTYCYKLEAFDKFGNSAYVTQNVDFIYVYVNKAPKAAFSSPEFLSAGVEELFDASASSDDMVISEYLWDFGDGTVASGIKAAKKYDAVGTYTVTLTVTDNEGLTSTVSKNVTVSEREKLGTLNVQVTDENGNVLSFVPVYFDLGTETQKVVYTDVNGVASAVLPGGTHVIGMYDTGYLPVKKEVVVLNNATRTVGLTTVKQDIVTGNFEITRMTFDEIVAAGIDVYDPANRNVYSATVRVTYGSTPPVTVSYTRNDGSILDYEVRDSNGQPVDHYINDTGEKRKIVDVTYIGNAFGGGLGGNENDIIAIVDIPAEASYLKEFFDVKLHIINNASPEFTLEKNEITLNVPEGMTLMDSVTGGYQTTNKVTIDSIKGQETVTLAWVLRGDEAGEYNLSADFTGTLALFDAPVATRFETETPIKVYGLEGVTFRILTASEIHNDTLYFNVELENNRDIDIYVPEIGLTDKIKNVTESVLNQNPDGDFFVESNLLNIYVENENGIRQYVPFSFNANGNAVTDITTLSPGQKIVYEYVAYNAINYDGVGYFKEAMITEFDGLIENIEVGSFEKTLYSFKDYSDKLDVILSGEDATIYEGLMHIVNPRKFYYVAEANKIGGSACEDLYKTADTILNLDFSNLTQEEERDLIRSIILSVLSDSSIISQADDLVMVKYNKAVADMIGKIRDGAVKAYADDDATVQEIGKAFADIIKDSKKLAVTYRTKGSEEFRKQLNQQLAGYALGVTVDVADYLTADDEAVSFGSVFGTVKDCAEGLFKALEESEREKYYYAVLKMQCNAEVSNCILDCIIDIVEDELQGELNEAILEGILSAGSTFTSLADVGRGENALVWQIATEMKYQLNHEMEEYYETINYAVNIIDQAGQIAAKKILQTVLSKAIGSTTFGLISAGFNIADAIFGFEDYYKQQDAMDIYNTMTNIFIEAFADSIQVRDVDTDLYSMLYLRAICEMRLSGERQFKKFMNDYIDGVYVAPLSEEKVLERINKIYKTSYSTYDEWYDDVQYRVVSARDLFFNIEEATAVSIPRAPIVSLDYDNCKTVQTFTYEYEYCFADGVWKGCENKPISFETGVTPSVLRVRKAASADALAGEITTVKIFARKDLSKLISVKFDGINYIISGLSADYNYQVAFVDSLESEANWAAARTIAGSTSPVTVSGIAEHAFMVIRSCGNLQKYETVSNPLGVAVSSKQPLNLVIEGSGKVSQSAALGCYYIGEEIDLIATPNNGEEFAGWYVNGSIVSTDAHYIAEMAEGLEVKAVFTGKIIKDVSITGMPTKIEYYEGESLDLNGLELTVTYGDAAPQPVMFRMLRTSALNSDTDIAEQYTAYLTSNTVGDSSVVINYGGKTASYDITIKHNTVTRTVSEASCGQEGLKQEYCTACKTVLSETVIPATGDHKNTELQNTADATCASAGYTGDIVCTDCGQITEQGEEIEQLEHTFGDWITTKEPTEEEEGEMTKTCSGCGATETASIPVLEKTVYGDTNGDGLVTINDAVLIARYSAFIGDLNEDGLKSADVNDDGMVNVVDATIIARFTAGLITEFPASSKNAA